MKISEHISYDAAVKSQIATRDKIANIPNEFELEAMKLVAENCFEPIRKHFGVPIGVSSFFRCDILNKVVKGSKTSQHVKGEAIDIDADMYGGVTNKEIYDWAKANLIFDQLIWEYGDEKNPAWVHISFSKHGNRNQTLTIK